MTPRGSGTRIRKNLRLATGVLRLLPSTLIIGAQKGGSTSLFDYLTEHPLVIPSVKREVGFFDTRFAKGVRWYRSHFPTVFEWVRRPGIISLEASTGYLSHPHTPGRIAALLPRVKLIAVLRNPIDRAYSHYHHTVRLGHEPLPFEAAIAKEEERLGAILERIAVDEDHNDRTTQYYSYLSRGIYLDQLQNWYRTFRSEQLLILRSEDLFADPDGVFQKVLEFLGLPEFHLESYGASNSGRYGREEMTERTREQLREFFEPHNQRLYRFLGRDFGWA